MLYVAETWQCSLYRFHTLIRMPPCRICNIKWHICTWFCLRMRDHFKDKGLCSDLLPCVTVNLHCQLDWNSNQLGLLGYGVSGESGESGGGVVPEKLSKGGKIHAECGGLHPIGWRKQPEHQHTPLCYLVTHWMRLWLTLLPPCLPPWGTISPQTVSWNKLLPLSLRCFGQQW